MFSIFILFFSGKNCFSKCSNTAHPSLNHSSLPQHLLHLGTWVRFISVMKFSVVCPIIGIFLTATGKQFTTFNSLFSFRFMRSTSFTSLILCQNYLHPVGLRRECYLNLLSKLWSFHVIINPFVGTGIKDNCYYP